MTPPHRIVISPLVSGVNQHDAGVEDCRFLGGLARSHLAPPAAHISRPLGSRQGERQSLSQVPTPGTDARDWRGGAPAARSARDHRGWSWAVDDRGPPDRSERRSGPLTGPQPHGRLHQPSEGPGAVPFRTASRIKAAGRPSERATRAGPRTTTPATTTPTTATPVASQPSQVIGVHPHPRPRFGLNQ